MNVTVTPGTRRGSVHIPCSKSEAHRALICAALTKGENNLIINGYSNDIRATVACLDAMACDMTLRDNCVTSAAFLPKSDHVFLPCGESGTTLRLLLPVVGALSQNAAFYMEGRLPKRPLEPLKSVLESRGMKIEKKADMLYCGGKLMPGEYEIAGNVSSQYISGLLLALPLLSGESELHVTGGVESAGYIALTERFLTLSGIKYEKNGFCYKIPGNQSYRFPAEYSVPADWSGAAAFACMGALSKGGITLKGLDNNSLQADKAIIGILEKMGARVNESAEGITVKRGELRGACVNAADTPDLVPVLSALAAAANGKTVITGAARLRLKESDRLAAAVKLLSSLGAEITETDDGLILTGAPAISGGTADPSGDHRMAMAAAVAANFSSAAVTVENAECVNKSYPGFWEDLDRLEVEE